ncbi:hypothetical protein BDR26DRAFT_937237 [Obelidium mucronatum]|nr:hypothetical protein BDR26DRAFT_937237 [Obelidium mucronatum]
MRLPQNQQSIPPQNTDSMNFSDLSPRAPGLIDQACYTNPNPTAVMDYITNMPTTCGAKCKNLKKSYALVGLNLKDPGFFDCFCIAVLPSLKYTASSRNCQTVCPDYTKLACGGPKGAGFYSGFASGYQELVEEEPEPVTVKTTERLLRASVLPEPHSSVYGLHHDPTNSMSAKMQVAKKVLRSAACPETPWLACGGSGVYSAFASGFQPTNPNPNPKTTTTRTIAFTSTIPIAKPSPSAPLQPTNIPAPPPIPQPQPEPQQPPPQPIPLPKPVPPQIKNPVSTLEEIQTLVPPTIPSSKEATTLDVKNLQQLATAVVSSTIKSQSSPTAFFTTVSSVSIPSSAISSVFAAGPQPVYTTTTESKPMSESNPSAGMVIGIVIGANDNESDVKSLLSESSTKSQKKDFMPPIDVLCDLMRNSRKSKKTKGDSSCAQEEPEKIVRNSIEAQDLPSPQTHIHTSWWKRSVVDRLSRTEYLYSSRSWSINWTVATGRDTYSGIHKPIAEESVVTISQNGSNGSDEVVDLFDFLDME